MWKKVLRWLVVGLFVGLGLGALIGLVLSRFVELPAVEALTSYRPAAATQVQARDGSLLGTFSSERRIPVGAEDIPKVLRDAIIAVEDANFYRHPGVDPQGMLRAMINNILRRRFSQGASTITQQLARTLFLTREKVLHRKISEMLLAIEIEQRFSKDQIFTFYANQVNFGHGNYGVEAASRFYFGKPAKQLSLAEAALLAGLPQRPGELSPIDYPKRALGRRNHVLKRMLEEKMIDAATYQTTVAAPLGVSPHYDRNVTAAYFIEEVRRSVEEKFGSRTMLEGGLSVDTTLDAKLQGLAEDSLREGLVELQERLGWPGARRNALADGVRDPAAFREESWPFIRWQTNELVYAVVTDVQAANASLLIGGRGARLPVEGAKWTGRTNLMRLIKPGDVVLARLEAIPADASQPVVVKLEAEPRVEGAILVLDNRTGAILALVGGFDFNRSQFDRSMQAKRQCGSAFKPFVYLAAWERGYSPTDTIFDGPVLLPDEKNELTYCPLNYERSYLGIVTFRHAVEHSLNASATKVQQMVTGEVVIDVARRLGITEPLAPYSSLALGSFELPMVELASAYSGIANRGQVAAPYFISQVKDAEGKVVEERRPRVRQALREDVACIMTSVMEGVIQRGTAAAAAGLPGHLAGKTGTTDRYTDAWFVGFSPRITCAVWVGRDLKEPIARHHMSGAEAALPTWMRFMKAYMESQSEAVRQEDFSAAAGVTMVPVDRNTGLRATPACGDAVILEAVPTGREPAECNPQAHAVLALPWLQQLPFYTYKPGEPPTTPEAIAAAEAKLAAEAAEEQNPRQP
ncbi:MAG TPA: PBP1A family penicillin-binding protein [Thermoanaerobaculaceae bacterium]|nr:PBP1A family penicillin-binding protein [Thermoanaerobaculaceae bacterium]